MGEWFYENQPSPTNAKPRNSQVKFQIENGRGITDAKQSEQSHDGSRSKSLKRVTLAS
jgi:hypothetical protein